LGSGRGDCMPQKADPQEAGGKYWER